jgi:hypothetical protein
LKEYEPTTGRVAKSQSASRRWHKLHRHGGLKILEGLRLTPVLLEPSEMALWFASLVANAEHKRQSLITRITTNLLKLCGFANHATRFVIRN